MKLKAILGGLAALALFTGTAKAEELRVGVLTGLNFGKLTGDLSTDGKTGWIGGIFGQYGYNENLFGEVQVRYIKKGGSYAVVEPGGAAEVSLSANYLEIPIYAKYKLPLDYGITPFVFGGPSLAFNLASSRDATVAGVTTSTSGAFNAFDLALDLGVGAEYKINEKYTASLSAAYNLGLLDVASAGSLHNRGFQLYGAVSMAY